MQRLLTRSALVVVFLFAAAGGAQADIPPQPDPTEPETFVPLLGAVAVIGALVGLWFYRRRAK